MSKQKYKIIPNAVSKQFLLEAFRLRQSMGISEVYSVYGEPNFDGTLDDRYASPVNKISGNRWRNHRGNQIPYELIKSWLEPAILHDPTVVEGVYDYCEPVLADAFLNAAGPGEYIGDHVDPPISVWDPDKRLRRANFNITISADFTGGETIVDGQTVEKTRPGDLVLYPQPLVHGIRSVNQGERFVIFGWIYDAGIPNNVGLDITNKPWVDA